MKTLLFFILLFLGFTPIAAQENFDISTLRMGDFTLNMSKPEIDKLTRSTPISFTSKDETYKNIAVKYLGETIDLIIAQSFDKQGMYDGGYEITSLSTKSKKFSTKSGMKIGSTKEQLLETYKNYPNFCVSHLWDEKTNRQSSTQSLFILNDTDASTLLQFHLNNGIVSQISVYKNQGE